jgi:hypothetical protein
LGEGEEPPASGDEPGDGCFRLICANEGLAAGAPRQLGRALIGESTPFGPVAQTDKMLFRT